MGVSAQRGHPSAEGFPDGAVPLQRALAAALQTPQTPTQREQRDSGGEHGLHLPSEEDAERSWHVYNHSYTDQITKLYINTYSKLYINDKTPARQLVCVYFDIYHITVAILYTNVCGEL